MTFSMCSFNSASFSSSWPDLRPDAAVDVALLVIGQVHQPGKILAEADRIKNREAQLAGRVGGKQPENDVVDRANRLVAARLGRFKKNRALARDI